MAESAQRQPEIWDEDDYPAEATVGDQSLRAASIAFEHRLQPTPPLSRGELRRRIARKAYELYVRRGRRDGYDLDDWLEAERIVASQLSQSQSGETVGASFKPARAKAANTRISKGDRPDA